MWIDDETTKRTRGKEPLKVRVAEVDYIPSELGGVLVRRGARKRAGNRVESLP